MARRLSLLLAWPCALALLLVLALALMRCVHPFELEWEEGALLQQVSRVLSGQRVYAAPSLEYMALPYTPLFTWIGALAAKLLGPGFLALRLVSILSSAACFVLLYRLAARRGGSPFAGWFAVGLYAASFRFCGAWFDVARVDALGLAFVLGALEILESSPGWIGATLAGLVFFTAFFAKQTALVPALCVLLALALRERRAALAFGLAFGVPLVGGVFFAAAQPGSWYRWYVFELLSGSPMDTARIGGFWLETLGALACVPLVAAIALWRGPRAASAGLLRAPVFAAALLGLVLGSWLARVHVGGYDNTLMPACAAAALVFGPALARALRASGPLPWVATALALGQFWLLRYDPRAQLPTEADCAAGEALVARLAAVEGEVWIPDHGYLAERAGKRGLAHGMTLVDLLQSEQHEAAQKVSDELARALESKRFAVIVLDEDWSGDLPLLAQNYERSEIPYEGARTFVPVTGAERRPRYWYARR